VNWTWSTMNSSATAASSCFHQIVERERWILKESIEAVRVTVLIPAFGVSLVDIHPGLQ